MTDHDKGTELKVTIQDLKEEKKIPQEAESTSGSANSSHTETPVSRVGQPPMRINNAQTCLLECKPAELVVLRDGMDPKVLRIFDKMTMALINKGADSTFFTELRK